MANNEKKTILGSQALGMIVSRFKAGTIGEMFDDWKWILRYTKQYRLAVVLYAVLGVVGASLGLLSAVASKYTIDIITGYEKSQLGIMLGIMIASVLFSLGFSSLISYISVRISLRVNNDIQAEIFTSVLEADWMSLSEYSNGDLLNRFSSDINTVATNAISWLPDILISLYTFTATFFVIWHYDHIMAFLALASAPFLILISRGLMIEMRSHNKNMKEASSKLMTFEAESFYNIDTIKSLGLKKRYTKGIRENQEIYRKASLEYNKFSIKTNIILSILGYAVHLAIFCYCLYLLWSGKIIYGTMTLFLSQGSNLQTTFSKLTSLVPSFLNCSVSAHRIRELQQLPKELSNPDDASLTDAAENGLTVCAESMNYAYKEDSAVFESADFSASPGEIVAFIGPSGEGKTTMLRLILGLVRPNNGTVYLKSKDGTMVETNAETRRFFSYVPQGNTLLSGTIAENLRMGKEDATDSEIEEALKTACAWNFVSRLPNGIYSSVGERGRGLSEGQAQRIAIARAILRDAPVLMLDEATSALDAETERKVLENIMRRRPNRTCILTTHRSSVLTMCSRVYRISDHQLKVLKNQDKK